MFHVTTSANDHFKIEFLSRIRSAMFPHANNNFNDAIVKIHRNGECIL